MSLSDKYSPLEKGKRRSDGRGISKKKAAFAAFSFRTFVLWNRLTLGVLFHFTRFTEANLFTFNFSGVTRNITRFT